tara:strand:- start:2661 stop:3479 length:819 start_codon:yes stop_codon:yes gene_type:complete
MEHFFEILKTIFTGPEISGLTYGFPPAVAAAAISGAVSIGTTIFGASKAKKERKRADKRAKELKAEIKKVENDRAEIINPFEGYTDLSSMAQDVSGMATAPKMNLAVATKGAEMQIEEADIALANTLDTLAASGASAGGATALAQMALKSKQGVAANIEQQEVNNQKLAEENRIEGQLRLENLKMQEAQRIQGVKIAGAERMQQAEAKGAEFMYREQETRTMEQLDRLSAQLTGQEAQSAQSRRDQTAITAAGIQSVGSIASGLAADKGKTW